MTTAKEKDLVLFIGPRDKRHIVQLKTGESLHTHMGIIEHDKIIDRPLGRQVWSHLGKSFLVLQPSLHDLILNIRRRGQIIYPKEAGLILLKMNIQDGQRIIEAGTGSGGLTLALAAAIAPNGRVYSYENREEMQQNAEDNLRLLGLDQWVDFELQDIEAGFNERDVDAVFLDVRTPWEYLSQAYTALKSGGFLGCLVPTTNQVSLLIARLQSDHFADIEVEELLLRHYKPVAERLRPADTMIGHTGFLIFARKIEKFEPDQDFDNQVNNDLIQNPQ